MKNHKKANKYNKVFNVEYTKKVGGNGIIMVKADTNAEAIKNARYLCFTGSDFRNPVETKEEYSTPGKQGFQGSERMKTV